MFNPEMMRMAQEMASKMTPEQMAQMQRMAQNMPPDMMQQAMAQMQNMTSDQTRQMQQMATGMSGDTFAQQAAAVGSTGGRQQQFELSGAEQLKAEGNKLHGAKKFSEAAEKYERALSNLQGDGSPAAQQLRTSCQANLASCFLQLERWRECADMCDAVLAADPGNRKALYRRGQALCALGRHDAAVSDLRRAVELSPESEKGVIREKLQEAQQKQQQELRGFTIEELPAAPAPGGEQPVGGNETPASALQQQEEGVAQAESDDDVPPLEEASPGKAAVGLTSTAAAPAPGGRWGGGFVPPGMPPGMDAQQMQHMADMLKANPDMARQAATAMSAMSEDQITAMAAQSGMPGFTPELAKQAAAMMRAMPPEQLSATLAAGVGSAAAGSGAPAAALSATAPAAPPATTAPPAASAAALGGDQMAAAAASMRQNPEMMKQAMAMMEGMNEEELARMAAMMPGMGGAQMDPVQMKMAARMMASMSPEDMERMTRMAAGMGGMGPAGPAGGSVPATGASGGTAAGSGMTAAGSGPASAAGVAALPAMGGFDPSSLPAGSMEEMRKRMQDPEMLKLMKGMMKNLDPAQLAEMMRSSGLNVTPEQARSMVDQLDRVSDNHLELMARLMGYVNAALAAYRRAKEWVFSQGALAVALLVLIIAVLLKWLGWL